MILQALVRYYEILLEDETCNIPLKGYSRVNVSYAVNLSKDGEIKSIIPLKILDKTGKKYIPVSMVVPEQEKKTVGITSNFLCENSSYVFGIDNKGKPDRSLKCFEAFKEHHIKILDGMECDEANALINYVNKWDPSSAESHPIISKYLDEIISGSNIVFQYEGNPMSYIHNNSAIKGAWEKYKNNINAVNMQCLVTGKIQNIARLHPSVKGIKGGQAMGNSLVSFNAYSYESYGNDKSQGLNAPVSEYATFAYTTALNHLLSDNSHKLTIGDATMVFWAESSNKTIQDCMSLFLDPSELKDIGTDNERYVRDEASVKTVRSIFQKIKSGEAIIFDDDIFDKNTKIYILGLSPNAARISVRFFIRDNFNNFVKKISKHYQDMSIEKQFDNDPNSIPVWKILYETVPPQSKDKSASPLLAGETMRAILQGTSYPEALYNSILIRIRAEHSINYIKSSIIKAYLLRNKESKNYKEELTMSLNEQSDNKAYVLGRLFAVLEKAQEDANPGLNATIKDRYFSSACATPASVFPILLRLSNHHIAKAEHGYTSENRIKVLMDKLDVCDNPFPKNLTLDEQGLFILGYYHQRNSFFKKVEKELK